MSKLVLVKWHDAQCIQSTGRWVDKADVEKLELATITSVGWIVRQTPDFITIFSHDGDDSVGGDLCIPWVNVIELKELEVKP